MSPIAVAEETSSHSPSPFIKIARSPSRAYNSTHPRASQHGIHHFGRQESTVSFTAQPDNVRQSIRDGSRSTHHYNRSSTVGSAGSESTSIASSLITGFKGVSVHRWHVFFLGLSLMAGRGTFQMLLLLFSHGCRIIPGKAIGSLSFACIGLASGVFIHAFGTKRAMLTSSWVFVGYVVIDYVLLLEPSFDYIIHLVSAFSGIVQSLFRITVDLCIIWFASIYCRITITAVPQIMYNCGMAAGSTFIGMIQRAEMEKIETRGPNASTDDVQTCNSFADFLSENSTLVYFTVLGLLLSYTVALWLFGRETAAVVYRQLGYINPNSFGHATLSEAYDHFKAFCTNHLPRCLLLVPLPFFIGLDSVINGAIGVDIFSTDYFARYVTFTFWGGHTAGCLVMVCLWLVTLKRSVAFRLRAGLILSAIVTASMLFLCFKVDEETDVDGLDWVFFNPPSSSMKTLDATVIRPRYQLVIDEWEALVGVILCAAASAMLRMQGLAFGTLIFGHRDIVITVHFLTLMMWAEALGELFGYLLIGLVNFGYGGLFWVSTCILILASIGQAIFIQLTNSSSGGDLSSRKQSFNQNEGKPKSPHNGIPMKDKVDVPSLSVYSQGANDFNNDTSSTENAWEKKFSGNLSNCMNANDLAINRVDNTSGTAISPQADSTDDRHSGNITAADSPSTSQGNQAQWCPKCSMTILPQHLLASSTSPRHHAQRSGLSSPIGLRDARTDCTSSESQDHGSVSDSACQAAPTSCSTHKKKKRMKRPFSNFLMGLSTAKGQTDSPPWPNLKFNRGQMYSSQAVFTPEHPYDRPSPFYPYVAHPSKGNHPHHTPPTFPLPTTQQQLPPISPHVPIYSPDSPPSHVQTQDERANTDYYYSSRSNRTGWPEIGSFRSTPAAHNNADKISSPNCLCQYGFCTGVEQVHMGPVFFFPSPKTATTPTTTMTSLPSSFPQ